MKKTKTIRSAALFMAFVTVFSMSACSRVKGGVGKLGNFDAVTATDANGEVVPLSPGNAPEEIEDVPAVEVVEGVDTLENDNLRYVMIYNPKIYDENRLRDVSSLKTGYLGNQVDVGAYRAEGSADKKFPLNNLPQNFFDPLPEDFKLEQQRTDATGTEYDKGDTATFNTYDADLKKRFPVEYTCAYEGQYCYIWVEGYASDSDVKEIADAFDTQIYKQVTEKFGPARFDSSAGKNGKVNLIFVPINDGVLGYFYRYDVFAKGEISKLEEKVYLPNYGHDIVYINEDYLNGTKSKNELYSTVAHEFQHLVMAVAAMNTYGANPVFCRTWINEAMSGYIQEELYPGSQAEVGSLVSLMTSGLVRNGQSLYNFTTTGGFLTQDIGVYGSVFVFSEYLADLAGEDVFSKFHKYWRESYSSTLCEAEALANSVPSSVKSKIANSVVYPDSVVFGSDSEEWMSKLTLDFYLSMFAKEGDLEVYDDIRNNTLIYNEINEAEIEGGGRIVVAVDGKFEIPTDADAGLIYIGLDENYKPVTEYVYK